jgi:hypothetical protein
MSIAREASTAMHITAQTDDDHADKLTYIQQQTQEEIAEILNRAIDLYYQQWLCCMKGVAEG